MTPLLLSKLRQNILASGVDGGAMFLRNRLTNSVKDNKEPEHHSSRGSLASLDSNNGLQPS